MPNTLNLHVEKQIQKRIFTLFVVNALFSDFLTLFFELLASFYSGYSVLWSCLKFCRDPGVDVPKGYLWHIIWEPFSRPSLKKVVSEHLNLDIFSKKVEILSYII